MNAMKECVPVALVILIAAAVMTTLPNEPAQAADEALAGPPLCPKIYAPVVCDNGKVYPNQCEADRKRATGCVPVDLTEEALAGPPLCPKIYAPVVCDNGKVYPNQCEADRKHATGCVPVGSP